jgi:hypothetical protein
MRELLRGRHFIVTVDDARRIVRRTRTAERFATLGELETAYEELLEALRPLDRSKLGQLMDARQAPPRNDPQFEAAVTRYHEALYRGFRATAVLVQSAAGRLQVRRMLDVSGVDAQVFVDESAAIQYLTS